jgi:hypothetical protein
VFIFISKHIITDEIKSFLKVICIFKIAFKLKETDMKSIFRILVVMATVALVTSCSTENQSETESLYETQGVDLSKIKRPGCENGC